MKHLKHLALVVFALLLWATPALADVSVVQVKLDAETTSFVTDGIGEVTADAPFTVGNYVVVAFGMSISSRTITSVVDSGGNGSGGDYDVCTDGSTNGTTEISGTSEIWFYCAPITSAASTITITISSALASVAQIWLIEVTGQHASTPIEDVAIFAQTVAFDTATVGPVTTAAAGSLVFGGVWNNSNAVFTVTAPTTPTNVVAIATGGYAIQSDYKAVGAETVSYTMTSPGNEQPVMVLVAIAPAAAAAGSGRLLLLGIGDGQ